MKKLVAIFAAVALLAMFFAQMGFAQEGGKAAALIDAPVKSVMLYSNGMGYVVREGNFESSSSDAYVKVVGISQNALFSSMQSSADGKDAYMQRYFEREVNVSRSEVRQLSLFELLNASMGGSVELGTKNGQKSGTLVHAGENDKAVWLESAGMLQVVQLEDVTSVKYSGGKYTREYSWNETQRERGVEAVFYGVGNGKKLLRMSYLESGASWEPVSFVQVGSSQSGSGTLKLYATLRNSGNEEWNGIAAKVVVGYPHISHSYRAPRAYYESALKVGASEAYDGGTSNAAAFSQSGQYYVYTIAKPVSLKQGEEAKYELSQGSVNYYKENVWETYSQYPQRVLVFNNTIGRPIAAGVVKVYEEGVFAGEESIEYVPAGKKVEVSYADLSDVSAKKSVEQSTEKSDANSRVTTYSVNMALENFGGKNERVRVLDTMYSGDKVEFISASSQPQMLGENKLQWNVDAPAGGKVVVSYKYRVTNYYNTPVYYG